MKLGLDWDGTFNTDKLFWLRFCRMAMAHEHEVYIVTRRSPIDHPIIDAPVGLNECTKGIYYTSGEQKRPYMDDLDCHIDIWIDDIPDGIE